MFGNSPQSPQGKIRLPRQEAFPDNEMLAVLIEQAEENLGLEIELAWSVPNSFKNYSVSIRMDRANTLPVWNIWHDDGQQSEHAGSYETRDLDIIMDVIWMLKPPDEGAETTFQAPPPPQEPKAASDKDDGFKPFYGPGQASLKFGSSSQQDFKAFAEEAVSGKAQEEETQSEEEEEPPYRREMDHTDYLNQLDPKMRAAYEKKRVETASDRHFIAQTDPTAHDLLKPDDVEAEPSPPYPGTPVIQDGQVRTGVHMGGAQKSSDSAGLPEGTLPADFYSDEMSLPGGQSSSATLMEGSLKKKPASEVLLEIRKQRMTGLLEIIGDSAISQVYFEIGEPKHAQTGGTRGDQAIKEVVTWRRGEYKFQDSKKTEMRSCEQDLETSVAEGVALLDQLRHLEKAGLTYESLLVLKHKELSETELKLMLSKGHPLDFAWQHDIYNLLRKKRTFTDLLRDRPMDLNHWAPLLFNFLHCGLLELKEPSIERGNALSFLQEAQEAVQNFKSNFTRPETGILTSEAMYYFLEYEYYRYEAYDWPLSLVLFEMSKKRVAGSGGDFLPSNILNQVARRINLVKRPLDLLGHFETLEFALLLPNTKPTRAVFIANRIMDAVTNAPLSKEIDAKSLQLYFGVAGLPADGDDLATLISKARDAKVEAREGTFPIVLSRTKKEFF